MAKYTLGGFTFNPNFFNSYMKNVFGEAFVHSSLSFEEVFSQLRGYEEELKEFSSSENTKYYKELVSKNFEESRIKYSKVIEGLICMYENLSGIKLSNEERLIMILNLNRNYGQAIQGAVRPFMNKAQYQAAAEAGELKGEAYETEFMIGRVRKLLDIIQNIKISAEEVQRLKAGSNSAFAYALQTGKLDVQMIKEINAKVNAEEGIHEGFKSVDNEIVGCCFETCPKEEVPVRIQYLMHDYFGEWKDEIPALLPRSAYASEEEWGRAKDKHLLAVCLREAKFHIEFERIHPFEDGNGRTGRIILNKNLIANEMAPIIITPEMRKRYLNFINERDYQGFAQFIYELSSVQLSLMVGELRKTRKVDPNCISIDTCEEELGIPKK